MPIANIDTRITELVHAELLENGHGGQHDIVYPVFRRYVETYGWNFGKPDRDPLAIHNQRGKKRHYETWFSYKVAWALTRLHKQERVLNDNRQWYAVTDDGDLIIDGHRYRRIA